MGTFSQDVTSFVRATGVKQDLVVRKLAMDAFRGVIMKSPVDTGRFRASWRIGIGVTDMTTAPEHGGRGESAMPADMAQLAALAKAKWGTVIVISNNVPYAEDLEKGTSRQAPNGVMNVTFEEVRAGFARTVASVQGGT